MENRSWMQAKDGPLELLREGRIGANEVLVYLHASRNHHLTSGLQERATRAMATLTGLCKSVVWAAWQKLKAAGLVVQEQVKRCNFGWLSRYRLWPFKRSIKDTHLENLRASLAATEAREANPPDAAASVREASARGPTVPAVAERVTVTHEGETFAFFPADGAFARIDAAGAVHPVATVSAAVYRLFAQVLGFSAA